MPHLLHLEPRFSKLTTKGLALIAEGCQNLVDLSGCANVTSRDIYRKFILEFEEVEIYGQTYSGFDQTRKESSYGLNKMLDQDNWLFVFNVKALCECYILVSNVYIMWDVCKPGSVCLSLVCIKNLILLEAAVVELVNLGVLHSASIFN
ncbi:hypothetical protein BUALT_Bualt12G0078300 [Buddleja alternifolia]|uniref:Uncharacterized protein n=1 Tax=Buddleja alternifolia TaxID=168488 RepID=A0AAV6WWS2_9LAMI|nr:hypothetical protein BUALT_Bualt12G0078300 [Buddleja alternifolia]